MKIKNKKVKEIKNVILLALIICLIIYIIYELVELISSPTEAVLVRKGEVSKEESTFIKFSLVIFMSFLWLFTEDI